MQATKIDAFFKPKQAAPAPVPDDEQTFVDFFRGIAKNPTRNSKKVCSRRVAVFGRSRVWGEDVTFELSRLPATFRKWCAQNGFAGHNSVEVEVFEEDKDHVPWHGDEASKLAEPEVVRLAFASSCAHRNETLAHLEFRWPKSDATVVKSATMRHGTSVRFDARKHERKRCERRVAKSLRPRVDVTLRKLAAQK